METKWFTNGPIDLEVKVQGKVPHIMRSWLARTLVLVAASDGLFRLSWVQGGSNECGNYGGSSHPSDVESYTIKNLASDVAAVAVGLSKTPVILFGHDWGAQSAYQSAILYPEVFYAVAGLKVFPIERCQNNR